MLFTCLRIRFTFPLSKNLLMKKSAFLAFAFVIPTIFVFSSCAPRKHHTPPPAGLIPPPRPVSNQVWKQMRGIYSGPVRITSEPADVRAAVSVATLRLVIGGNQVEPLVFVKGNVIYSSKITPFAMSRLAFTNIPSRQNEAVGVLEAWTHAPNQIVLNFPAYKKSPWSNCSMIVTFRNGAMDVRVIGGDDWTGEGRLAKLPDYKDSHD